MARSPRSSRRAPRVLVICHANRWRSPIAAACLAAGGGLEVRSAGFRKAGLRAASRVRLAAQLLSLDLEAHVSAVVSPDLLAWADLVVYMDGGNRRRLAAAMREAGEHRPAACLGAFCDPPRSRIKDLAFVSDRREFLALILAIDGAAQACRRALLGAPGRRPGQFVLASISQ